MCQSTLLVHHTCLLEYIKTKILCLEQYYWSHMGFSHKRIISSSKSVTNSQSPACQTSPRTWRLNDKRNSSKKKYPRSWKQQMFDIVLKNQHSWLLQPLSQNREFILYCLRCSFKKTVTLTLCRCSCTTASTDATKSTTPIKSWIFWAFTFIIATQG